MKPIPTRTNDKSQSPNPRLRLALAIAILSLIAPAGAERARAQTNYQPIWGSARQSRTASRLGWNGPSNPSVSNFTAGRTVRQPQAAARKILADIGPNHRSWRIELDDSSASLSNGFVRARGRDNPPVKAIASGMNYWDGRQWLPSEASFDLTEDAFVATKVQHRTRLNADLNVIGAVTTTLRDGTALKSTPVAIALYDPNDGRFAVVSTLTNSFGILVDSNRVVFPEAFRGGVCADVVYTVQKGSWEQDVVIAGRLDPRDYNFPTNCQIQIITEFYDAPRPDKRRRPIYVEKDPAVRSRKVSPDRVDEVIGWGEFVIGTGHAYTAPSERNPTGFAAFVSKELMKLPDGRVFLVETVEHRAIQKALEALPACETRQAAVRKDKMAGLAEIPKPASGVVVGQRVPPVAPASEAKVAPRRATTELAHLADRKRGVTIDYRAHVGGTINETKVFQGDTTWLVVDAVYCAGPVVIEGGAVFKHSRIAGCGATLTVGNTLTLQTSSYRPAIFTAMDDDSMGESAAGYDDLLTGYTGQIVAGGYANPALLFDQHEQVALHDLRFLHAVEAVRFTSEGFWPVYTVTHSQFVDCLYGITVMGYSGGCSTYCGLSLQVQNSLFSATDYPFCNSWPVGIGLDLKHCTLNGATAVVGQCGGTTETSVGAYNCIFSSTPQFASASGVYWSGSHNGFHDSFNNQTFGTDHVVETEWPFAPVGYLDGNQDAWYYVVNAQGGHYLRDGSPFTDAGTPNIPQSLKDALCRSTTVVPELFNYDVNSSQTLSPTPIADCDTPNLGYHYPVVHYVVCGATVNNCTLNVDQGTVLAFTTPYYLDAGRMEAVREWYPDDLPYYEWGIRLNPGGRLNVNGVPTNRVVFARLEAVQESSVFPSSWGDWCPMITFKGLVAQSGPVTPLAELKVRYADFSTLASLSCHVGTMYPDWFDYNQLAYDHFTYDLVSKFDFEGCHFGNGWFQYDVGGVAGRTVSLRNNVFERSIIDFFDYTDHENQEESVEAKNNLFYFGYIWLTPLVGANWTFTDNIFDHVMLGASGPVGVNHHNAYVGMTIRLSPTAPITTDPDLAALIYQTGSLGRFYLPASATLLIDKGSQLAKDAGMFHFTSYTSNAKEGNGQVNIGPHYLALASGNPVDSNSDGISDFVADRNGNGDEDSDEMHWTTVNTGTLAILSPLDNATVSGVVQVRSDLGADGSTVAYIEVLVDGSWARGSSEVRKPGTSIDNLEIDTTYLSNGPHQLQIRATYAPPLDGTGRDRVTSDSSIKTVTVANAVNYPSWQNQAELAVKVAMNAPTSLPDYALWFFDSTYPIAYDPTPISSANGVASAGAISFSDSPTNLRYGNSETDPDIYSIVELAPSGGSPAATHANKNTQQNEDFPPLGEWVVSYQDSAGDYSKYEISSSPPVYGWSPLTDPVDQLGTYYFHGHILGGWSATAQHSTAFESGALVVLPGGASQTWPIRATQGNPVLKRDSKRLLSLLTNKELKVRNFFGHGHGLVLVDEIGPVGTVGFMGMSASELKRKLKSRRYRFVFLNGCETASDLFSAFGAADFEIYSYDGTTLDISMYSGNLRPAAYLGWKDSPHYIETVNGQDQFNRRLGFFVGQIASNWSIGKGWGPMRLEEAIREARDDTLAIFGQSQGLPLNHFVHHGYRDLRCSEYEHAGDWP